MDVQCRKRKRPQQCSSVELPMDLLMEIFSRLSASHIIECYNQFVNLEFRSMIRGKNFAKLFDKHSRNSRSSVSSFLLFGKLAGGQRDCTLLEFDNVAPRELSFSCTGLHNVDAVTKNCPEIVNACHSWLLIDLQHEDPINGSVLHSLQLVNPITGEKVVLPEPQRVEISEKGNKAFRFGFGFSPKTCQYKVLRLSYSRTYATDQIVAEILTLQSSDQSWRRIDIPNDTKLLENPVVFDGFICWKEVKRNGRILRFDVDDETFRFLPINNINTPDHYHKERYTPDLRHFSMNALGVLDGCLYVHEKRICWEMRREDEWTSIQSLFDIELPRDAKRCAVVQVLDRKKILFNLSTDGVRLAFYDLTEKKWEKDVLNKEIEETIKKKRLLVRQFVPSFRSLESLINGDR